MSVHGVLNLAHFSRLTGTADDDGVDRINHLYTVVILFIFTCVASGGQFVNSPIECWMPANFPGTHIGYTRSYCWVKNTYYVPLDQSIPMETIRRESRQLTYYQWVPFILMFMALLFKFPCFVWRLLNGASAISLDRIITMAGVIDTESPEKRKESIRHIALYVDRWLQAHRRRRRNSFPRLRQRLSWLLCFFGKREGTYLTRLYISVKLMYVVNVVCQFFLLNAFMGDWYGPYGLQVLRALLGDSEWRESSRFPRATLCDVDIRQLQNVQRYTVQCVLPINMYNEKIFLFLWFWLCGVSIVTAGSLALWVWRVFFKQSSHSFVEKYLGILDKLHGEDGRIQARGFLKKYLRDDGVFVLRLLAMNSNDILLMELVQELWGKYGAKGGEEGSAEDGAKGGAEGSAEDGAKGGAEDAAEGGAKSGDKAVKDSASGDTGKAGGILV